MDTQTVEYLNGKIAEEVARIQESLASGVAKDYAEYQRLCGVIQGLLTAQREANDLLRRLKEHDDSL